MRGGPSRGVRLPPSGCGCAPPHRPGPAATPRRARHGRDAVTSGRDTRRCTGHDRRRAPPRPCAVTRPRHRDGARSTTVTVRVPELDPARRASAWPSSAARAAARPPSPAAWPDSTATTTARSCSTARPCRAACATGAAEQLAGGAVRLPGRPRRLRRAPPRPGPGRPHGGPAARRRHPRAAEAEALDHPDRPRPRRRNWCADSPGQLSGGELQRAALARALLARPRVLICDEITSGLDTVTRRGILDVARRPARATATAELALVLITHDLDTAAVAHRIAVTGRRANWSNRVPPGSSSPHRSTPSRPRSSPRHGGRAEPR